ncbi:zinc ribbon domain-containing protein [Peribacillus butanolivorans]|uniref:zinc ribbon domain-containing protein n=1 Tax=Peribacillus butanolivorans TaxID=421767 RepID=UPI0035E22B9E
MLNPSIIDVELYEQTQLLRSQRAKEGKKATSPFPFSGVLRCGRCGSSLSGYYKKARGSKHYICIAKKNKGTCDLPMFTENTLTKEFLESLSPDNTEQFIKLTSNFELESPKEEDNDNTIKELENELSIIKTRKKNWLLALGNGVISQEEYLTMTKDDSKNEDVIKEQLSVLSQQKVVFDKDPILNLLLSLTDLWNTASDYEKKSFINELFKNIVVDVPSDYYRAPGKTPNVIIKEFTLS